MTDHDAEIVKAAWNVAEARRMSEPLAGPLDLLERAFAAKRESERPKLLTAEEAWIAYCDCSASGVKPSLQAVLDACLDRAMQVIEALPRKTRTVNDIDLDYVNLDDIRRALRPGAAS